MHVESAAAGENPTPEPNPDAPRRNRRTPDPVQDNLYHSAEDKQAVRHLEHVLLGENLNRTRGQVAEEAGLSLIQARRIWRSLGFPKLKTDDIFFTAADVEALKDLKHISESHGVSPECSVSLTRSVGQLMDRMVAWQIEALVEDMTATRGISDSKARHELLELLPELMDDLERVLTYGYRRMMNAAVLRLALRDENSENLDPTDLPLVRGVGFADMVSYTTLSRRMNEKTLSFLVKRFEERCAEIVAVGGGRIIKTIGDEILFLTETPEAAARISLMLSQLISEDPDLPEARVSFVWGRILPKLGDIYGPTVNLASRLVAHATPGVVITDEATAEVLDNDDRFKMTPMGAREVRGFGDMTPVAVTPGAGIGHELEIDFE